MNLAHILRRPIITEKSAQTPETSRFIFAVDRRATKGQIKQAVEQAFRVNVIQVNTLIMPSRFRRTGRRRQQISISPSWKKAIVQLKTGETIDLFAIKETK